MAGHQSQKSAWDFNFEIFSQKNYNKVTAFHVHTFMSEKLNYFLFLGRKTGAEYISIYYVESRYEICDIVLFDCYGWTFPVLSDPSRARSV